MGAVDLNRMYTAMTSGSLAYAMPSASEIIARETSRLPKTMEQATAHLAIQAQRSSEHLAATLARKRAEVVSNVQCDAPPEKPRLSDRAEEPCRVAPIPEPTSKTGPESHPEPIHVIVPLRESLWDQWSEYTETAEGVNYLIGRWRRVYWTLKSGDPVADLPYFLADALCIRRALSYRQLWSMARSDLLALGYAVSIRVVA